MPTEKEKPATGKPPRRRPEPFKPQGLCKTCERRNGCRRARREMPQWHCTEYK